MDSRSGSSRTRTTGTTPLTGRSTGSSRDTGSTRATGSAPTRDRSPASDRADGLSGGIRDALSGSRPTTGRGTPASVDTSGRPSRTTYGRPDVSDRGADPIVDLRPASSPRPQRVRFPRSYDAGQRDRLTENVRGERADALDRSRLYAARIAGRDAAVRTERTNALRDRTERTRTNSAVNGATSRDKARSDRTRNSLADRSATRTRSNAASPDRARLSDSRVERARAAREQRAEKQKRTERAQSARDQAAQTSRQKARQNEIARDARAAHRVKAKQDPVYADRVRADAKASRVATELALNTGLSLGITLSGGYSSDFGLYSGPGYWDDSYRPAWCAYPSSYGLYSGWAWNAAWWWYRPYYPSYSSYIYAGWWYPWSYGYYGGSTVYRTEVVYVQEETLPAEELFEEGAGGGKERAPGADSEALRRSASRYLQLGDDAFQLGEYGRAVHYYAKAIELSPNDGVLYLVLSDALFATGDYHYAAYALRRAFELEPELSEMQFDKRDLYSDPQDFEKQLGQLELYLDDHFLDEDARLLLAANYLFGGAPERALEFLEDPFSVEVSQSEVGGLIYQSAVAAVELQEK